jgi:hypothetical protein
MWIYASKNLNNSFFIDPPLFTIPYFSTRYYFTNKRNKGAAIGVSFNSNNWPKTVAVIKNPFGDSI